MIDPDTLYFSSEKYRNLLDVIGDEITDEGLAQRKGSPYGANIRMIRMILLSNNITVSLFLQ